ncbi:MAG: hypothetical protein E3J72_05360 [Planctomycetota bacterium]|nr:MAG: hypothetical protein E3J72_05360 [Planctomycetota bacterium]
MSGRFFLNGFYISLLLLAACALGFWFLFSCETTGKYEKILGPVEAEPEVSQNAPAGQPEKTPPADSDKSPGELDDDARARELAEFMKKLVPLHKPLGKPGKSDWLSHHSEPGQTFEQYIACNPERPAGNRSFIYVQPLGDFSKTEKKIILLTAKFMTYYFNLQIKLCKNLPLSTIPKSARRVHPKWKDKQILAPYILDYVLRPRLPDDAMAYIAFTNSDLWPGEGWNFVYGLASLRHRVGVWSIYRNGDPDESDESFRLCPLRTIKMASHETGHMFSMKHCIKYECNMCGCNNRTESDRLPLALCPECTAKICWATKTNPLSRYRQLSKFCGKNGLEKEKKFYEKSANILKTIAIKQ